VHRADDLHVPIVLKSGSLILLEPSGPVMGLLDLFVPFTALMLPDNLQKFANLHNKFQFNAI